MVPWVGLQCVIVAFPAHTHLLFGLLQKFTSAVVMHNFLKIGSGFDSVVIAKILVNLDSVSVILKANISAPTL